MQLSGTVAAGGGIIGENSVAVLICTMNRPTLLRRCLDGLASGTRLPDTVVVVDQSTDDATRRVVHEATDGALAGCRVRHHRSTGGMARGQNEGFGLADTSIVLVLDDDCVPTPDWVEVAARALTDDEHVDLIGGRVLPLGPDEPSRRPVAARTSTVPRELDGHSHPWEVGSGNNFAARRVALIGVGGNDERLGPGARFGGGADMDLFRRIMRTGAGVRYEPALVVHHERATPKDRRRRRFPYGFGVGIACTLWWRQRDRGARTIVVDFLRMRARRARRAIRQRDVEFLYEEIIVIVGTLCGLVRGAVVADPAPVTSLDPT